MWSHGAPWEGDQRKQERDFKDTDPKFFLVSPILIDYKVNPIPKVLQVGEASSKSGRSDYPSVT